MTNVTNSEVLSKLTTVQVKRGRKEASDYFTNLIHSLESQLRDAKRNQVEVDKSAETGDYGKAANMVKWSLDANWQPVWTDTADCAIIAFKKAEVMDEVRLAQKWADEDNS